MSEPPVADHIPQPDLFADDRAALAGTIVVPDPVHLAYAGMMDLTPCARCQRCSRWHGPLRFGSGIDTQDRVLEDACDHGWPGWRFLPVAGPYPALDTELAVARWERSVTAVYPNGWLEAGGPVLTTSTGHRGRHIAGRTRWHGHNMCARAFTTTTREDAS